MSETTDDPNWLDEFQELANRKLGSGSSCEQVHPVVERWYNALLEREPPASRELGASGDGVPLDRNPV